jgi:hypothetical protein
MAILSSASRDVLKDVLERWETMNGRDLYGVVLWKRRR